MYTSIKKFLMASFEFSNIIGSWNSYDRCDPCNHWTSGSAIIPIMWKPLNSDCSIHSDDDCWDRLQAPVVRKLDSAIHQINRYPEGKHYDNQ